MHKSRQACVFTTGTLRMCYMTRTMGGGNSLTSLHELQCLAKDAKFSILWEATQAFFLSFVSFYFILVYVFFYLKKREKKRRKKKTKKGRKNVRNGKKWVVGDVSRGPRRYIASFGHKNKCFTREVGDISPLQGDISPYLAMYRDRGCDTSREGIISGITMGCDMYQSRCIIT